jgi:hypothetical protein
MDEETITKIVLVAPWIVAIVAVFVLGVPWYHTVSEMDTVLYQVAQTAQTGATPATIMAQAYQSVQTNLPEQMDGTTLFNPATDVTVTSVDSGAQEIVTLVYHFPVFAPFVTILGMAGPTIPFPFSKTVSLSSANNSGVNYTQ